MATQNPYEKLKENATLTATKEELTLMLYDGALKFCNQAIIAIENKNVEKAHNLILKVQNIIREFQITLDRSFEVSNNLAAIYDYLHAKLVEANLNKKIEILHEVRDFLRELRDTWKEAMQLAKQQQASKK